MYYAHNNLYHRQRGSALLVSLVILLIVTILSLSAMNSSIMQQKMSANFQETMETSEYAQSIMDIVFNEIYDDIKYDFHVKGADDDADTNEMYTICFSNQTLEDGTILKDSRGNDCNDINTWLDISTRLNADNMNITASTNIFSEITQYEQLSGFRSRADKGSSAGTYANTPYEVRADYNDSVNGYGQIAVVQGYLLQIVIADDGSFLE